MGNNTDPPTKKDIDDLATRLRGLTGAFGKFNDGFTDFGEDTVDGIDGILKDDRKQRKKDADSEAKSREYERTKKSQKREEYTRGVVSRFKVLEGTTDTFNTALVGVSKALLGGAGGFLVEEMHGWAMKTTATYQELAENGQTFSGSLIQMSMDAAESGMSLDRYAKMMVKNSTLAGRLPDMYKGLGAFAKGVRSASADVGNFGYTVDGMNDLTNDYLERQIRTGRIQTMTAEDATTNIQSLAQETAGLADVFKKSRADITKTASEAMETTAFVVAMTHRTGTQFQSANKQIEEGITGLAALPGQIGVFTSQMAAQAVGRGSATQSKIAQEYYKHGMGELVSLTEGYAKDIQKPGADQATLLSNFNNRYKKVLEANLDNLNNWADGGDEYAREMVKQYELMKNLTPEMVRTAKDQAKVRDAFTKQMVGLDNAWGSFMGNIRKITLPIFGAIAEAMASVFSKLGVVFDSFEKNDGFKVFQDAATNIGAWINSFVTDNQDSLKAFGKTLAEDIKNFNGFHDAIGSLLKDTFTFGNVLKLFQSGVAQTGLVIAGLVTSLFVAKKVFSLFTEGLAKRIMGQTGRVGEMIVHASKVIVYGGSGGGGGGLDLGGGKSGSEEEHAGKNSSKRGWRGKIGGMMKGRLGRLGSLFGLYEGASEIDSMIEGSGKSVEEHEGSGENKPKTEVHEPVVGTEPSGEKIGSPEPKAPLAGGALRTVEQVAEDAAKGPAWSGVLKTMKGIGSGILHMGNVVGKLDLLMGTLAAAGEVNDAVHGRETWGQAGKNMTYDLAPAAGGWVGGAIGGRLGAGMGSFIPVVGTAIGEIAGNIVGDQVGRRATSSLLDTVFGENGSMPAALKDQTQETTDMLAKDRDELKKLKDDDPKRSALVAEIAKLQATVEKQTDILAKQNQAQIALQKKGVDGLQQSFSPRGF